MVARHRERRQNRARLLKCRHTCQNGLYAFFAARNDLAHLWKSSGERPKFLYPIGGTDQHDVIDIRAIVERREAMGNERPSRKRS